MGLLLDPGLLLDKQVAAVAKSTLYQLPQVSQLLPFLSRKNLVTVIRALITSILNDCSEPFIGLPQKVSGNFICLERYSHDVD